MHAPEHERHLRRSRNEDCHCDAVDALVEPVVREDSREKVGICLMNHPGERQPREDADPEEVEEARHEARRLEPPERVEDAHPERRAADEDHVREKRLDEPDRQEQAGRVL